MGQATIAVQGTDLLGQIGYGEKHFTVIDVLPDFRFHSENIAFSEDNPDLGDTIAIEATIHASSDNTIEASDIPVTFYAKHPAGDYGIGQTQYTGRILPGESELVVVPSELLPGFLLNWYIRNVTKAKNLPCSERSRSRNGLELKKKP